MAAQGKEMAEHHFQFTLLIFQLAGWNIQWKKTSQQVSQDIRYLGFEVDSIASCYRLPLNKLSHLLQVVARELAVGLKQAETPVRVASELLGRLSACRLFHGKVPHHVQAFATSNTNGSRGRGLGLHNRLAGRVDEGIEMDTRKFGQIQQQGVQG